jgi:Prophage tail length tape measure protein
MTVEAKLRLTTDATQVRSELKAVEKQLSDIRRTGLNAGNKGQFQDLQAQSRTLRENLRGLSSELGQFDKAQRRSVQQNLQLSAQLQDFAVQVQAGQSPLTAFIQQGSQLSFIYGGAGNALKAVAALFTPLVVGAGLAAAGVGALGLAWLKGQEQSAQFNRAILLTGGYAGLTAGQFESMAGRISGAVDGSIGGAKETLLGLVSTGKFTGDSLEPVAVAIEKVAALTGKTREKVVEEFAAMADGGVVKFAEKLNSSYNFLDLKTYDYIKALVAQGNESKAQVVLAEQLSQSLGKVSENLGVAEGAWRRIGKVASEAWDAFLGIGRTETVEGRALKAAEALAAAERKFESVKRAGLLAGGSGAQEQIDAARAAVRDAARATDVAQTNAQALAAIKQTNEAQIAARKRLDTLDEQIATKAQQRKKALDALDKDAKLLGLTDAEKAKRAAGINERYKDASTPQLTRLASAKRLYDGEIELAIDAAKREQQILQQRFDAGLVDLQAYLAQKRSLQDAEANADISKLQAQLEEETKVRNTNAERAITAKKRGDKNGEEQANESLVASTQKINELTTQIAIKERDRLDSARQLTQEAEKLTRELAAQQKATDAQIKQALGTASREDIARAVQDRFQPQLDREFQLGGDGSLTQRLIDITALREVLAQTRAEMERTLTSLKLDEDALRQQQEAGLITQLELEQRIYALRQASLPVLKAQGDEIERLAAPLGEQERIAARQSQSSVRAIEAQRSPLQQLEQQARDTAANGFGTMFSDIISGSKSAGEALRDMVGNFAKYMLDLIAKRLGEQLLESLFPKGAGGLGGGGGGGFLSSVFSLFGFHSGGVVRPGGQTFTRSIPAGLAMAAAQYAPRYHTGGIAGFKPNERLAVLEQGEEVLTADDPRHIANYRGGSGGVMVSSSITINGAKGDAQKQERAGNDLQQQINTVIDQWALREKRPGGLLAS